MQGTAGSAVFTATTFELDYEVVQTLIVGYIRGYFLPHMKKLNLDLNSSRFGDICVYLW